MTDQAVDAWVYVPPIPGRVNRSGEQWPTHKHRAREAAKRAAYRNRKRRRTAA